MVMKTTRPTDKIAVVGNIDPDAYAAGTYTTGWIAAKDFAKFMALVMVGTMAATSTVDAKIEQATDGSGTGAKDVTGKAITQITQAGTDQSDTQAIIEFDGGDLDVDGDFDFVRLSVTVAAAASDAAATVLGIDARYGPASDNDADSVGEIIGLDA